jgi:hypothetical protein
MAAHSASDCRFKSKPKPHYRPAIFPFTRGPVAEGHGTAIPASATVDKIITYSGKPILVTR